MKTYRLLCCFLPVLPFLSACQGDAGAGMGFPPPQVNVVTLAAQDFPVVQEYTGETRGVREIEIRPRVSGIIERRVYAEGAAVAAGAVLFQIDPKPYEARLAAAEAALSHARALHSQSDREVLRLRPLIADKLVSRKALDDAESALELARADVQAAEAAVREARLNLEYTRVTAPIAGVAGLAEKVEGALVKASEDRLTTITDTRAIDVYFSLSENELLAQQQLSAEGRLQNGGGLRVKLRLADGRVPDRTGEINFSDARIDAQTGTLAMRARLDNADGLFKSGQFVRVLVEGAVYPQAIAVPQRAVLEGPQGKYVYVLGKGENNADVAQPRPVEVGDWLTHQGERLWLIRNGLAAGDRVILDNLIKLYPMAPVQPAPPAAATEAASAAQPQG